jgi:hypothetical protein
VTEPVEADVIEPDDPEAVRVAAIIAPAAFAKVRLDPFALAFDPGDFDLNPGPFDWP